MISDSYKAVLRATRETAPNWGGARRHAHRVAPLLAVKGLVDSASILDFGSGAGRFADELARIAPQYRVTQYDPSVPGIDELPAGVFDAVVCTHVLEHVEPELLAATLEEIRARARLLVYIELPHGPAVRKLADGRNAHLIQESAAWWLDVLRRAFAGWRVTCNSAANPLNTIYILEAL